MRYFLVDFENVHSEGLLGIEQLTETDEVTVFYSMNADSISFDVMNRLMECKAKVNYYKIKRGGKNALDFQLSSYLGMLIATREDTEFFIISRDSGFDFTLDLWQSGFPQKTAFVRRFPLLRTYFIWCSGGSPAVRTVDEAELVTEEMAVAEIVGAVELTPPELNVATGESDTETVIVGKNTAKPAEPIKPIKPIEPIELAAEAIAPAAANEEKEEQKDESAEIMQKLALAAAEKKPHKRRGHRGGKHKTAEQKDKPAEDLSAESTAGENEENPNNTDKATKTDKPEKVVPADEKSAEKPAEAADKSTKSEKNEKTDKSDKPAKPTKPAAKRGKSKITPAEPTVLSAEEREWIDEYTRASKNSHEMYIGAVKKFGQKRGLEVYRAAKG